MEKTITYRLRIDEIDAPERWITVSEGDNGIGRHSESDICVGCSGRIVSKQHAVLTISREQLYLRDCGSTNGTFVNGMKVSESLVDNGDIISLGENGPKLSVMKEETVDSPSSGLTDSAFRYTGSEHADGDSKSQTDRTGHIDSRYMPDISNSLSSGKTEPRKNDAGDTDCDRKSSTKKEQSFENESFDAFGNIGLPLMNTSESDLDSSGALPGTDVFTTREIADMMSGRIKRKRKLSNTQEIIFSRMGKAYRRKNRGALLIFGIITVPLLLLTVFFARGYNRNRRLLAEGMTLRRETENLDKKFERLRGTDSLGSETRESLLMNVRARERRLDSIMSLLPGRYHSRFYGDTIEQYLCEIMAEFHEPFYRVPPHMLQQVKFYVNKFAVEQRAGTASLLRRKEIYFPHIERVFRQYHVPPVLAYVAMQESALRTNARSSAGAVGMWQFIESTGKRYGLSISRTHDDRTDWKKATNAAARYLHNLVAEFGEGRGVLLAVAAYNTGEHNVRRALRKIRNPILDRDFWYLYRTSDVLVEETREYVPQILARIIIDRHREHFGFEATKVSD